MLERLIYLSTATQDIPLADVNRIVARSQVRNRQLDVTGMLLFNRPEFVQVLEGRREALDDVIARIAADPRHRAVRIIDRSAVTTRHFERWSMELLITDVLRDAVDELKAGRMTLPSLLDAMVGETGFIESR